jgi:hypothetical protein
MMSLVYQLDRKNLKEFWKEILLITFSILMRIT